MQTILTVIVTTPDDTPANVADAIAYALDNPANYPDDAEDVSGWDVYVGPASSGSPLYLWEEIKPIIHSDGAWPGDDLVPVVDLWLQKAGIDTGWTPDPE
jgi:hypothetical protein